jgi:hypothetical protein
MRVCGQEFTVTLLNKIQQGIDQSPAISRSEIARRVCTDLNWRTSKGELQQGSCRKALARLAREGHLQFPPLEKTYAFNNPCLHNVEFTLPEACCSLDELGRVTIEKVGNRKGQCAKIWNTLMERFHYLGSGPLCGARIRYLVNCERYGYIGALAFSSATFALDNRDRYIGWSEPARLANIKAVVLNSRFLIVPSVHVRNLASHVLSESAQRIKVDWYERYGVEPVLLETFVDPTRFDGTCYKAANWIAVGSSAGRRDGVKKNIYLYPLTTTWQERLCNEPAVVLGEHPGIESAPHWVQEEFGRSRLWDQRLKDRLYAIAQGFYNCPVGNIPEAFGGSYAAIKGAYRFFNNRKISMNVLLTPHVESTIERIKGHRVVLAPQDTTSLNYYAHPSTIGLGPINNVDNTQIIGMMLHDTVAFTPEGTPLGVLDAQCWVRDPEDKNKVARRHKVPIEEKESVKWLRSFHRVAQVQKQCPDTLLVSMGDREADIYDLFVEALKDPDNPKLLVRANKNRCRTVQSSDDENGGEKEPLWSYMGTQPIAGTLQIHIPKSEDARARDATVQVRFSPVVLLPPKTSAYTQSLSDVWGVYLFEEGNSDPATRIEWLLLTTVPVNSFEDAKERVEWYSGRWGIEVYHRTLKSGCRIEDRQLGSATSLQACLGVDMVVAWRIYHLTMLGREVPNHPCTVFFEDVEWKALCCYTNKTSQPPETPPSLVEALRMVGKIGGHIGRKSDGMPGTECIWRGIQKLDVAIDMFNIFTNTNPPQIRHSYTDAMLINRSGP